MQKTGDNFYLFIFFGGWCQRILNLWVPVIFTCSLNIGEISEMVHMTYPALCVFFLQRLFIIAKHEEINLLANRSGMSVSFAVRTAFARGKGSTVLDILWSWDSISRGSSKSRKGRFTCLSPDKRWDIIDAKFLLQIASSPASCYLFLFF